MIDDGAVSIYDLLGPAATLNSRFTTALSGSAQTNYSNAAVVVPTTYSMVHEAVVHRTKWLMNDSFMQYEVPPMDHHTEWERIHWLLAPSEADTDY